MSLLSKKIVVRNKLSNLLRHVRSHPGGVPSECCFCKESSSNYEDVRQFLTQHYLPNHYDMYFGVSRGRSNAPKAVPGTNIEPTPLADDTNDTMSSVQRTEMEPMDMGTSTEISCAAGDQNSEIISITLRGPQSPPPICDLSHEVQQIRNDSTDMRHELEGFRHELKDFRNELKDNQDHLKAYLDLWGKTLLSHISYKVGSR